MTAKHGMSALTAERIEELALKCEATQNAGASDDFGYMARALRNLAAGIRECEATFAAYERHSGHYEDGKFDACDRINDILTGAQP